MHGSGAKICLIFLCLLCGCRDEQSASYDRMRGDLIFAALDAVGSRDHLTAVKKLQRLSAMLPESAIIFHLLREEIDNAQVTEANAMVAQGDTAGAAAAITRAAETNGRSARLSLAQARLAGVEVLQLYVRQLPFDSSDRAVKAVANLPPVELFPDQREDYVAWLRAQSAMVADLRQRERRRLLVELVDEIDAALAANNDDLWPIARLQFAALEPDHPLSQPVLPEISPEVSAKAAELMALMRYLSGDRATAASTTAPVTYCGRQLAVLQALQFGDSVAALAEWGRLRQEIPSSGATMATRILRDRVRRGQATAAPALTTALQRLHLMIHGE